MDDHIQMSTAAEKGIVVLLYSGRPKRVNTETTETEISVRFAEPKPKIPNRNSAFKIH